VADSGNNRVEKFTSNGTFITKWAYMVQARTIQYADNLQYNLY